MSTTIDNRAVQLGFDNVQFETGVKTSLNSLDSLKKGLDLTQSAKSLESLAAAGRNFSMEGVSKGVDTIANRFSALGVIGFTILQNLTLRVIELTTNLIKAAIGVDGIKQGFAEYELKMGAIQTIMAGTGESLDTVNAKLNELNEYSDKTIYSFSDMTQNIGKFTNAGVSLEASVAAIKGIANAAALSGANSNEAARAMYNFSQALSSGYVKLIDWKSIELANMATKEFKDQLLESAVAAGTLTKTADGMYKTLKGTVISATKGFNDSLQEQWMTTQVLTKTLGDYADETTEIGKRATAAAQDVKTFTQLTATLKEAIGSGWAQTFEILIGNFDEAKALFTEINGVLGGMVQNSADSRNKMLQQWKDWGGRTMAIDTLRNAFLAAGEAVKPIIAAFKEIFPPGKSMALILWKITFALWQFSKNLKMGAETADKVKRIFKGIFAVFDIVRMAVVALWKAFVPLFSNLSGAGDGLLDFLARIGDFLVRVRDSIKAGDLFSKEFAKIAEFVGIAKTAISNFILGIKEFADSMGVEFDRLKEPVEKFEEAFKKSFDFSKIDLSGLKELVGKFKIRFAPLEVLVKITALLVGGLIKLFQFAAPILEKLAPGVIGILSKLGSAISEGIKTMNFSKLFDLINTGLLGTLVLAIKNFLTKGGGALGDFGGIFKGISGILDGVRGSLEAYQKNLQAKTLMTIAIAIGILTASLLVLSMIDSQKLTTALLGITALFAELGASMALMNSGGAKGMLGSAGTGVTLLAVATSLLIMAAAIKSISDMDPIALQNGLIAIGTLLASLTGFVKIISTTSSSFVRGAISLILLGAAIKIMVGAVENLGNMDVDTLKNGLLSLGVILAELAVFMVSTNFDKMGVMKGLGLLALSAALLVMVKAVEGLGNMDPKQLQQGLLAIGAVLAEMSAFVILTQNGKSVIATSIGMVLIAASMLIFAQAIKEMGSLSTEQIAKGLLTMGGALLLIALAMEVMPASMALQAIGLVLIGGAMILLADALTKMGNLSWKQISKGLVTLAGALLIIALGLIAMQGGLGGAAALLVVAGALSILAPVLKQLGSMSVQEIALALLALAGSFIVFGVAGLILGPLTPVLLALAGAMMLLGGAIALIGVGVLLFSTGMATLAVSGTAGALALVTMIGVIAGVVPQIVQMLATAILQFLTIIAESTPTIVAAFVTMLTALLDGVITITPKLAETITTLLQGVFTVINNNIPGFLECVGNIITAVLAFLVEKVPEIVQAAFDLLISFLSGIRDNLPEVVTAVGEIITSFLDAIGKEVPRVVEAGYDMLISLITGMTNVINEKSGPLNDAVSGLAQAIIDGLTDGILGSVGEVLQAIYNLGSGIIDALKLILGIASPSDEAIDVTKQFVKGAAIGLADKANVVGNAASGLGDSALNGFSSAISAINGGMTDGLDAYPTITPVVDLTNVLAGSKAASGIFGSTDLSMQASLNKIAGVATNMSTTDPSGQKVNETGVTSVTFNQNNYSPESLSAAEIYRQTRNQLLMEKGLVGA